MFDSLNAICEKAAKEKKSVWQVVIELRHDPNDPERYDWSTGDSEGVEMSIGTYCNVLTETRRRSMYEYLFN